MKEKMVTRTVIETELTFTQCDLNTMQISEAKISVLGKHKTEKLETLISKQIGSDFKVLRIIESKIVTRLYGMKESQFVELAEILPDRIKKEN